MKSFRNIILLFHVPFLAVQSLLFIIKNREVLTINKFLCCYFMVSLGHSFWGFDCTLRFFHPEKSTIIFIPYYRTNEYLIYSFHKSADILFFRPFSFFLLHGYYNFYKASHIILRYILQLYILFKGSPFSTNRKQMFFHWDYSQPFHYLRKDNADLLVADFQNNIIIPRHKITGYKDLTGYMRLLEFKIGHPPSLPNNLIDESENNILKYFPSFNKNRLITLHLRKKGSPNQPDDFYRTVFSQNNYYDAIKYLSDLNYHIVGIGEINHDLFENIKNYINVSLIHGNQKLLNIYFLTNCVYFVGVQSGPSVIPNSIGIPTFYTNSFPLELGSFSGHDKDLIIFKRIISKNGDLISLPDIYNSELVYGLNIKKLEYDIIDNSPQEILEGVKQLINGNNYFDHSHNYDFYLNKFRSILNNHMQIYFSQVKPTFHFLRNSNWG